MGLNAQLQNSKHKEYKILRNPNKGKNMIPTKVDRARRKMTNTQKL